MNFRFQLSSLRRRLARRYRGRSSSGFTFLDSIFATSVVGVAFAGLYSVNTQSLFLLHASREAQMANALAQDRIEQIQSMTISQVSNSTTMTALLKSPVNSSDFATTLATETVKVSPFTSGTAASPALTISRSPGASSATATTSSSSSLSGATAVQVDVEVDWSSGQSKRSRTVTLTTILGQ